MTITSSSFPLILLPLIFLIGSSMLLALKTSFELIKHKELAQELAKGRFRYFFFHFLEKLFPKERKYAILDTLHISYLITTIGYAISASFYLIDREFASFFYERSSHELQLSLGWGSLAFLALVFVILSIHILFHLFASSFVIATLKLFSFISTFYMMLCFPFVWPILWLEQKIAPEKPILGFRRPREKLKEHLLALLHDADVEDFLDLQEKQLIRSLAQFGDLVAREIMIPRVDMMCLPKEATVWQAMQMCVQEGYSRIPIYQDSLDHIIGVLLYKDIMTFCFKARDQGFEILETSSIESLINSIIYTPENRLIHNLFEEMRQKQIHTAIVVNEYGGTEGLVTQEDLLEELVGKEIRDEHDKDEKKLFIRAKDQSWIVDAKMSIVDIEKEFDLSLPHTPEYETIAGYICWKMGVIPLPGTILYEDLFQIQVLESDQRQLYKIKISKNIPPQAQIDKIKTSKNTSPQVQIESDLSF